MAAQHGSLMLPNARNDLPPPRDGTTVVSIRVPKRLAAIIENDARSRGLNTNAYVKWHFEQLATAPWSGLDADAETWLMLTAARMGRPGDLVAALNAVVRDLRKSYPYGAGMPDEPAATT